jgi:hypothetical protein
MATTTSACANGEDGYSDKPITVYFYDKKRWIMKIKF